MGGNSTKHKDKKMASGDFSSQPWNAMRFAQPGQENVEVVEDGRKARFQQQSHPSVITCTRQLMFGDVICINVSGSGHVWAGLVCCKPAEAAIRGALPVRSERRDYLLHFRLKKTDARVRFLWEERDCILVERMENGVLQQSRLSSQNPLWPVVDILFGDVKTTLELTGAPQLPPLTFDPNLIGDNIQLSGGNMQASPLVDFPRCFCWGHRELKPSEVVKLDIKPFDSPRWYWVRIYLTTLPPEVLAQSNALSLFQGLPKNDFVDVKKVRNHTGGVEMMLSDLGDRRELSLTCQAKLLQLPLRRWSPDTRVFLCLELFRVEVQISSYVAPTPEYLYKQTYAERNRRQAQSGSGEYLHPIHPSALSSSPINSRERPVASVTPINLTPQSPSENTSPKLLMAQDQSQTFRKERHRQQSSSSSSRESLDQDETHVMRPYPAGSFARSELSRFSEQETFQKVPVGGHAAIGRPLPRSSSTEAVRRVQTATATPFSRQHSVPPERVYSEDGYDDFVLADYGEATQEPRVGYESLNSLQSADNQLQALLPGGASGSAMGSTPSISDGPNSGQTVQSLVKRFEELKQFVEGTPRRGSQDSAEQSNLALELELECLQQQVDSLRSAIRKKSGTKADEDLVEKLGSDMRKMSVRCKSTPFRKSPFYNKLRRNYIHFLDSMDAVPIADYLFTKQAITQEELQNVRVVATPKNQCRKLLDSLLRRPNAEEIFREALKYSDQRHLLDILDENVSN